MSAATLLKTSSAHTLRCVRSSATAHTRKKKGRHSDAAFHHAHTCSLASSQPFLPLLLGKEGSHVLTQLGRRVGDGHTGGAQRVLLALRSTHATRHHRTSVAHAATRRRRRTADERHDRLLDRAVPDKVCSLLLRSAADLANQDDALRLGSFRNSFRQSTMLVPLNGSPPMPTHSV